MTALDEASKQNDLEFGSASLLVMESAGNILNAYHPMQTAADAVLRAVQGVRLRGRVAVVTTIIEVEVTCAVSK